MPNAALPAHDDRSDDDIAKALSWCEERVLAINESMLLDNSKTLAVRDTPRRCPTISVTPNAALTGLQQASACQTDRVGESD